MAVDSLSYVDDEGLVAQAQELDHAVLVESDATGCVGLVALAVDEDGRTLLIDALAVVTGGHPIIVLGHVGVHVLAVALVVHTLRAHRLAGIRSLVDVQRRNEQQRHIDGQKHP